MGNSQRTCHVQQDSLSRKTDDPYRLLNSLSLRDASAARNSFFAFYYCIREEYPYNSSTCQVSVLY